MISFPLLVLVLQLGSALWSLPAPVGLRVTSLNFQHVLHWEPGPGSPPGTRYNIYIGVHGKKMKRLPNSTSKTSFRLNLMDQFMSYTLTVQAVFNHRKSPQSRNITFIPYRDTIIGPPALSLAGCGTCIQGNISLPVPDINKYDPSFVVSWRKEKNGKISELVVRNKNFTLKNLEEGAKFCFRIQTKVRGNSNTQLSDWTCTFSSPEKPETDMVVIGVVSALLVLVPVVLTTGVFCFCYTGVICKLKKAMPQALMNFLWENPILTPDGTISDQIFISADTRNQKNPKHPTASPPPTGDSNSEEEEDEEEDNRTNLYMDRAAELSSGQSSQQDSGPVCGNLKDSGSCLKKNPAAEMMEELQAEPDQYEFNTERVFLIPEGGQQTGVQEPIPAQEEEIQDVSGDVNLFSVTLASLAPCDEDEMKMRNSLTDLLKEHRLNSWSQTNSETEQGHQMLGEELSGSSRKPADTCVQLEEEEEEEEEFSAYLTHRCNTSLT